MQGQQESELGRWTLASRPPDPRLRSVFARDHIGFTETDGAFERWLEPPRGTVTVIINLGDAFGGLPDAFVAGLDHTYSIIERSGSTTCIDLKLTPIGAFSLLGSRMDEITGRVVDIREFFGAEARQLLEAVREAPSWGERFEVLDAFLLQSTENVLDLRVR